MNKFKEVAHVGADTRFPVGGGANPWGRQHTSLPDFPKNCMKLRKFWSVGVRGRSPLDPPMQTVADGAVILIQFSGKFWPNNTFRSHLYLLGLALPVNLGKSFFIGL